MFGSSKFKIRNLCNGKYLYVKNVKRHKDYNPEFK